MIGHPLCQACAGVLLLAAAGAAQGVGRDAYYAQLPSMPPRVGQTAASVRLALYGDPAAPGYHDQDPVDGVDDARAELLLRLAARFSPVLRRNNFSGPQDFRASLQGRPVLYVDTWGMGTRLSADTMLLHDDAPAPELARSDSALAVLVLELHPDRGEARSVAAEDPQEKVLFLDFPGAGEQSWREAYHEQPDSRIYAHFFVNEERAAPGGARYDLAIQYWFFYPFNDGPNNHEGDWEHLVVLVTTPAHGLPDDPGAGRLDEAELAGILAGDAVADSLVIRAVEYYFHETVLTLDYAPARAAARVSRLQQLGRVRIWEEPDFTRDALAERLDAYGGRFATHPIGYIGGNSKGPDELMAIRPRFGGSYNRNAHGTYPFPGTWQGVGPLGSAEAVVGRLVPKLKVASAAPTAAWPPAFADEHFLAYGPEQIELLPDWERLKDLVVADAAVRRQWSWVVLPIRWGYPATASPGGGAIAHVDLGQVAPEGPMFQPTWNRLAANTGFRQFTPRVLRVMMVPLTPWDRIQNGWGVLNLPRILLGFLPGWSVFMTQLAPWLSVPLEAVGLNSGRTFAPERRPNRFTSSGVGVHRQLGGSSFARLLPRADDPGWITATGNLHPLELEADTARYGRSGASGLRAWLDLHYGPSFTIENAYTRGTSVVQYRTAGGVQRFGVVRGELELQELLGGFRARVADAGAAQLFAGGGWGWTWYEVKHVSCAGQLTCTDSAQDYSRKGGYAVTLLPSRHWWPNTLYGKVGMELTAPRSAWLAGRLGYGVLLEYSWLTHRLGATHPGGSSLGPVWRRELSVGLAVSW